MCSTAVRIFLGFLNVEGVAESLESFVEKCKLLGSWQGALRVENARGKGIPSAYLGDLFCLVFVLLQIILVNV